MLVGLTTGASKNKVVPIPTRTYVTSLWLKVIDGVSLYLFTITTFVMKCLSQRCFDAPSIPSLQAVPACSAQALVMQIT